jgi:hypothetical protein
MTEEVKTVLTDPSSNVKGVVKALTSRLASLTKAEEMQKTQQI